MSENKTPKPLKSQTFDYGNPLRTSTFDSDPLKSESVIAVRPLSTSEYKRFRPIAKAYNLPVPEIKLNVIKGVWDLEENFQQLNVLLFLERL